MRASPKKPIPAADVSALLAPQIESLCRQILPNGHREKDEWRCGSIAGEEGRSLGVHLRAPKLGQWIDSANTSHRGDALDLVAQVLFGGNLADARRWALDWLGLSDGASAPEPRPQVAPAPTTEDTANERRRIEIAHQIWRETLDPKASPVETYIRFRGSEPPASGVLRFHPACPCGSRRLPAMVAPMSDPLTGKFTGVHRTFLRADGRGKADIAKPKLMLGKAGVIRVTADEALGSTIGIGEGIETMLSVQQHLGIEAVWATGSAWGIADFPILAPQISSLAIFPDMDDNGASAQAARGCAERWAKGGREVRIHYPPAGHDWNSCLSRVAA